MLQHCGDDARYKDVIGREFNCYFGAMAHVEMRTAIFGSGRIDDVLNVSGHRLGTEIESALVARRDCRSGYGKGSTS